MKTYAIKRQRGVDDLLPEYAFYGNSQGDETHTNSIEAFNNSNGWLSFIFPCALTDEAIQEEAANRKKSNAEYIQRLKAEGRYTEEYEMEITLVPHPRFEELSIPASVSHRFILFDLSKIQP
jgi:hypothetical protein